MDYSKDKINEIIKELKLDEEIKFEDIPSIDLYMDQVITLFENNLQGSKRSDNDKILTKTMINNYAKDKLLMTIKNKKYTRNHIVLMILIYNLKQSLAISDIKFLLKNLVSNLEQGDKNVVDLEKIYKSFLSINKISIDNFEKNLEDKLDCIEKLTDENGSDYEEILLMVLSLISTANMHRRMAEKIIDNYFNKEK